MENKLVRKAQKIFHNHRKSIYQSIRANKARQSILFIVGCQRSGTSMLLTVFNRDLNTKCFAEFSTLTSNDTAWGIRLNSSELLKKEFANIRAPLIVVKPLVESQNILELLNCFDHSWAVWMFRNHRDVVFSNIQHFGINNGLNDLRPVFKNEPHNWRSENVAEHVHETVSKHFSENMNPYDAAALFWFARNSLYFDLKLYEDPRVILCQYEDFVLEPEKSVKSIYQQVGQVYPTTDITSSVHSKAIKKGKHIELSPQVEQVAQELQYKLEAAYRAKTLSTSLIAT